MLRLQGIETCYGSLQVLFGVDLEVREGEVVSLLGRNGMGKTTTVRTIMGLAQVKAGVVSFCGQRIRGLPPYAIAKLGLGLVPEGRQIFPNLTVEENLVVAERNLFARTPPWDLARVYRLFPQLEVRRRNRGDQLSGGEQQMLAIGRALATNPRLLILDEASEGLAPLLRAEIWRSIKLLKEEGQSILIIDSNLKELLRVTDRNFILEKGRIVWEGSSGELTRSADVRADFLGV